jgi:hypothetical protein
MSQPTPGPGIILIKKKRPPAAKDGHVLETVSSTYADGDISLLCPKPGDVCTIQYRCFILESTQNGPQQQRRRLVDSTKGFDEPAGDLSNNLLHSNNSRTSRPPLVFEIGKGSVVRGLEVAVQRMLPLRDIVYEVILPYSYAYGHRGHLPEIPPRTDLLLQVILEKIHYKNTKDHRGGWFEGFREMVERFWNSAM